MYIYALYIATVRFFITGITLLIILLIRKEFVWLSIKDLPLIILLGLSGVGLYNALVYIALNYTSSVNSSLIKAINPITTIILSHIILKEKTNNRPYAGIISIVGIFFIITKGNINSLKSFNIGDIVMLFNVLLWSCYNVLSKKISNKMNPIQISFWVTITGTILIAPFGIYERIQQAGSSVPTEIYIWIAYLGIFASGFGMIFWQNGVKKLGTTITALIYNLIPIFTIILSIIIYNDPIDLITIFGGILAIFGTSICICNTQDS